MSTIAYLVNQYPKASHTFIRREIAALERRGWRVERFALRGWDARPADPEDVAEQSRTRYVLQEGILPILMDVVSVFMRAPARLLWALILALRMAWRAERGLPYHLAYLAEACRLAAWLRASRATHLHAHFGTNSAEVAMLARELGGPPYSFTVHGPEEFDQPRALGLAEKARRAAFVVAISSYGRSQLYRWLEHAHWSKVKLVRCGLEAAFHDVEPSPPPAVPRLACVGRLCEQKGQLVLLEAAARLAERGRRFELVLVGDGEMRPDLETFIQKNQLDVRITGWVSSARVRAEILAARALVLPSFAEGLPVVIMEAMALRRPVLATCVAGVPELVQHGETGWLCPPGDVDALAAALEDLLSRPPAALQAMGEAGHARVLERHSVDASAARLAGLFAT